MDLQERAAQREILVSLQRHGLRVTVHLSLFHRDRERTGELNRREERGGNGLQLDAAAKKWYSLRLTHQEINMADSDSLDAFLARRDAIYLPVLAGLLGTGAIVMAVMWLINVPVLHADAQRAEATVTKLERVSVDVPKSRMLHDDVPVVRFQDGPRQVEVRVTNANHRVGKFSVGQKVTVVYRAGRPEEARIPSFFEFYLPPLAIGGVGVVFDLMAVALFTAIRRKKSAAPGEELKGDRRIY